MAKNIKPAEIIDSLIKKPNLLQGVPPETEWFDTPVVFEPGNFCHAGKAKIVEYHHFPNPREWRATDEDWKLPENWKEIVIEGIRERLDKFRSFKLFMDICVRCGACADKCHFFIGSGDPKNMPVLRAELMRSIYRGEFTTGRQDPRAHRRRPQAHQGRDQRVVHVLLPVHRVPPLLGLLPVRHRHRRGHDDGARDHAPHRRQHQLDPRAGGQLQTAPATTWACSPTPSRATSSP